MLNKLYSKLLSAVAAAAVVSTATISWAEPLEMRISLDTAPAHARNRAMESFVEVLNERAAGQLNAVVFGSAQLFKDRDVAKALRQGGIDMALPGFWYLGGMVPEATAAMLPVFYGLDAKDAISLIDAGVAPWVNPRLEAKTNSHVLGDWLTMGGTSYFLVEKRVETHSDIDGLKLRVPGGALLAAQAEALGATTVHVPFSDLPLALSQGTVDGFLSSAESVVSAKLWDAGVKYEFGDNGFFAAYVPMISNSFWEQLSPELQEIVTGAWRDTLGDARALTAAAQTEARTTLGEHGVTVLLPTPEASAIIREKMMQNQDALIDDMKMDAEFIAQLTAELDRSGN